jgi:hypothetical protein
MDKIPSNIIKSKMKLKGIKSKELAERLKEYDVHLSELSLNNKLSRGGFSAVFFFKCMKVLNVEALREEEWR